MVKAGLVAIVRVGEIMSHEVVTVEVGSSLHTVAKVLSEHRIGGAPVLSGGTIVGLVSKSDLVDPRNGNKVVVDEVMTRVVYAVRANDPVMLAVQLMADEGIHRALVVDDAGALVGVVAPIDVLRALRAGKHLSLSHHVEVEYVDLRRLRS